MSLPLFPRNKPRSVAGQVRAMARPARPPEEAVAVREAAEIVRRETGLTAISAISREIAKRVTADLTTFIDQDRDDPMVEALGAARRAINPSPFYVLATDPVIDTLELFLSVRTKTMQGRAGKYLSEKEAKAELWNTMENIGTKLKTRYATHLYESFY